MEVDPAGDPVDPAARRGTAHATSWRPAPCQCQLSTTHLLAWQLLWHRLVLAPESSEVVGPIGPAVRLEWRVVLAACQCYLRQTRLRTDVDIA